MRARVRRGLIGFTEGVGYFVLFVVAIPMLFFGTARYWGASPDFSVLVALAGFFAGVFGIGGLISRVEELQAEANHLAPDAFAWHEHIEKKRRRSLEGEQ
jgi:hypothetical protein